MSLYYPILFFTGSYILTFLTIPKIIGLVEYKNLMDSPNNRSSHVKKTPTLGGVSFFYTLILALFFLRNWSSYEESIYIMPGLTVLFIIGLKDDLVVLSPYTKLAAQLISVFFILSNESFMIHSLNGFMGIYEIPFYVYYIVGGFIMVTIINAYNLIDGIDGLAAIVGIIILIIYATIFYMTKEYFFLLISLTLNGCLIAFLKFNFSTTDQKIFMGDTGSLIVGYIISILTLKFLALSPEDYDNLPFLIENIPLIAISILIVPLFDTARVFTIRLANKRSPFSADRNHTHHILIDYFKLSHKKASLIIGTFNLLFVYLFIILGSTSYNFWLATVLVITVILLGYFFYRYNYSFSNIKRRIRFKRKINKIEQKIKKKPPSSSTEQD
ncbi:undecaprenyl/decaprenyl-phosphate alpha-N-acetylglucosaminyl 1-phosphate transferase [Algibacter marinivivus]|uniref:Undecaprenyl/decaprenyl-phosphate alpha-N-acetylglucosaminyl 1-phosphate transferase n=1 Tax=Algibacter marinivivus TaxID=2100723 RepID=A0A2U2X7Y3_9FLAO|nr:MraY family glycosyltransferase [Algibacter marinivivus]PWH83874.1 undecaprenyl/decaprenyl-phosphate alpha-N-acetylglucosaminyl 1-phosphate transferase [Algibacter marinivivus]